MTIRLLARLALAAIVFHATTLGAGASEVLHRRPVYPWPTHVEAPPTPPSAATLPRFAGSPEPADAAPSPVDFAHYPSSAEIVAYLQDISARYPNLTELYTLGTTWQGRPIIGLRVGVEATGNPDARPALYVDGQHHGREPISQQVALYLIHDLLTHYGDDPLATYLLDSRTLYVIPCVNPDGNDVFLTSDINQRKNANPAASDDDYDGDFDEDPPNEAGLGTYVVRKYSFRDYWVQTHPDNPFVDGWEFWLTGVEDLGVFDSSGQPIPQIDDDGDDSPLGVNEDPVGGVDPNRNYDAHWERASSDRRDQTYRGASPWSEPEARAVRDFVSAHPGIRVGVSLHSGEYLILHPWGWSDSAPLFGSVTFERLARKGSQLTEAYGMRGAPHTWTARGLYMTPGSAMDWLYMSGAYSFSPEVYKGESRAKIERIPGESAFRVYSSDGLYFNPPPDKMLPVLQRWNAYLRYLMAAAPGPVFTHIASQGESLRIAVANEGGIPVRIEVASSVDGQQPQTLPAAVFRGAERAWTVALAAGAQHTVIVTATSASLISTSRVQDLETVLTVQVDADGAFLVTEGSVRPFNDLAPMFGGWDADPGRWDTGSYHVGPPLGYTIRLPQVHRAP